MAVFRELAGNMQYYELQAMLDLQRFTDEDYELRFLLLYFYISLKYLIYHIISWLPDKITSFIIFLSLNYIITLFKQTLQLLFIYLIL